MIEYSKKAAGRLALIWAFCLPWVAAEAWAGVLGAAQGAFTPIVETAAANPAASGVPGVTGRAGYESAKVYTGDRISLDFQNEDLHSILRILGEVAGKNIVVSGGISGRVTLKLRDVPWDQALDIVLTSRNLGFEESGDILTVYDLPTLQLVRESRKREKEKERQSKLNPPQLTQKMFSLKYASVETMAAELNKLKSRRGQVSVIGDDIYIEDEPNAVALMTQKLMRLDRAPRLVQIEVKIVEAGAPFAEALGLRWLGVQAESGGLTGKGGMSGGDSSENNPDILILSVVNKALNPALNAEPKAGSGEDGPRILSAPRFLTENDKGLSIRLGGQIPSKSDPSAAPTIAAQLKAEEVELKVRPYIGEDERVLTLDLQLINEKRNPAVDGAGSTLRTAEKKIMVKDGQTVAIGGVKGGGGRWPLLDWLSNDRPIEITEFEMLIFVTANIIPANM